MSLKVSLLIPTIESRRPLYETLHAELARQAAACPYEVEILSACDNGECEIGRKRNQLLAQAHGEYCAFIDDDDWVSSGYLLTYAPMIEAGGYDCASMVGAYYCERKFKKLFLHSVDIPAWSETPEHYLRMPNHLNLLRTKLAQQAEFPASNHGEDHSFSSRLQQLGVLKNEYKIPPKPIYHYLDGMKAERQLYTVRVSGDRVLLFRK